MKIPEIVPQTFGYAPFARAVTFHRTRELYWKPEVQIEIHDRRLPERIPPPPESLLHASFVLLPATWVGSVYFSWNDTEQCWTARIALREPDIRDVCGLWQRRVVQQDENVVVH